MSYSFGDWVVYDPGYKQEIGRVTECRERSASVCYHQGCTAASTPLEHLRPATDAEIAKAPTGIGYHRFDATCPIRDEWLCAHCRAVKQSTLASGATTTTTHGMPTETGRIATGLESGEAMNKLTAEQVRECTKSVYFEGYADGAMNRGGHIDETDWQEIADKLNAKLSNDEKLLDLAHNAWSIAVCAMQGTPIPASWGDAVEKGLRECGIDVDELPYVVPDATLKAVEQ